MSKLSFKERRSIETQISEFGITPLQLFSEPHPKRFSQKMISLNVKTIQDSINKEEKIEVIKPEMKDLIEFVDRSLETSEKIKKINENINENLISRKIDLSKSFTNKIMLLNFHFKSINSIDIYESTILSGGSDGFVKALDINVFKDSFNNKTLKKNQHNLLINKKMYIQNISNNKANEISKVKALNKELCVIGDLYGMINVVNYINGKSITSSLTSIESIKEIYNFNSNLLVIDRMSSNYIYSLNSNLKSPILYFKDLEHKLVNCDFRNSNMFSLSLDVRGNICLRSLKSENEKIKFLLKDKNLKNLNSDLKYIKFSNTKENEFFICTEENFYIYDIRKFGLIEEIDYFYNSIDVSSFNNGYMMCDKSGLQVFNKNESKNLSLSRSFLFPLESSESFVKCFVNKDISNNNLHKNLSVFGNYNGDMMLLY